MKCIIQHFVFYKILQNKPWGLYFSKTLLEGPIFGGAYLRREIFVSKLIGLAYSWKEIYCFYFVLLCIWGQFPSRSSLGHYIGRLNGGFFALQVWRAYKLFGGAYFSEFYSTLTWFINFRQTNFKDFSRIFQGQIFTVFKD